MDLRLKVLRLQTQSVLKAEVGKSTNAVFEMADCNNVDIFGDS